jgi:hypothetical protein
MNLFCYLGSSSLPSTFISTKNPPLTLLHLVTKSGHLLTIYERRIDICDDGGDDDEPVS